MTPLSILGAKLNGERVDVLVDNGRIKEIRPAGIGLSVGRIIDAKGGLLTAPYADPPCPFGCGFVGSGLSQ